MASDLNGNVVSAKLYPGKYILSEIETSKGYQLLNDNLLINVDEIDQNVSLYECNLGKIVNKYVPVNDEVKPIPKTNAPIMVLWVVLLIVALVAISFLLVRKIRRKG